MPPTYRYPSEPVPIAVGGAWRRGLPWTIDAVGAVSLYDTRVNRPGAGTLPAGSVFFATDTGECFSTNGVAWTRVPWSDLVVADVAGAEATANKGAASGYAGLDAGTHVPQAQLGTGSAGGGHKYLSDAQTFNTIPVADVTGAEATANKGAASGYAGLDAGTHVPQAQLGTGSLGTGARALFDDQTYKPVTATGSALLKLFDSTLGADAAVIDTGAGGIAATADSLLIVILSRTSQAAANSSISVTFNNDVSAIYDRQLDQLLGTTRTAATQLADTKFLLLAGGDTAAAGSVGVTEIHVPGYAATAWQKTAQGYFALADNIAGNMLTARYNLRYRSTAAISRVAVAAGSGVLRAGSRLLVYGE